MNGQTRGRVLVLGLGASGIAAARLLSQRGWSVALADERVDQNRVNELFGASPPLLIGDAGTVNPGEFDQLVVSPGIPAEHRWLQHARSISLPIIPEFELGLSFLPGIRVIAVTGTNGKSSLVKWISDTLCLAGLRSVPAGNYGMPPCELALQCLPPEAMVLELSSFQLEQSVSFHPSVAVLLNLSPNHLDRHPSLEAYAAAKARMFARMTEGGTSIIHAAAWPMVRDYMPNGLIPVWLEPAGSDGYGYADGWVTCQGERVVDLRGTWWDRLPLGVNAAAGVAAMHAWGITTSVIERSAREFAPLAHRMEVVAVQNGVRYINDSKASTMSALAAAVGSGASKKHLIAGGILKERDVNFVKEILAKNCAYVYCIGQAAQKLVAAWGDIVPCEDVGLLETAVRKAGERARSGEDVLLSPGCSSFDQFTSYAQRGEKFKRYVQQCTNETITRKT